MLGVGVPFWDCVGLVVLFYVGVVVSSVVTCSAIGRRCCPVLLSLSLDLLLVDRLWVRITLGRVPFCSS